MTDTKRLVVLISGRGSNMSAILEACQKGVVKGRIVAVFSNREDAAGLRIAAEQDIPTAVVNHRAFESREAFDRELLAQVLTYQPDFVILAGFMRILSPAFVAPLAGKLINIHPSLLPKYPGLDTHRRAIEAGDRESGATVHFVTEELDGGPAILQVRVPVERADSADTLATRILDQEHRLYVEAVNLLCDGRVLLDDTGRALYDGKPLPPSGIIFPEQSP